jgi:ATP-dependent HslUV protease, peptidase subunit HslV
MIVADSKHSLQITGNGDVLEPHDGIIGEVLLQHWLNLCLRSRPLVRITPHITLNNCAAIGSGGAHAGAASRALRDVDGMDAQTIGDQGMAVMTFESVCNLANLTMVADYYHAGAAQKAMKIAADADIYTNHNFQTEVIGEASGI